MLKWLGISALAVAAFVAFMATGSGSAAESGAAKVDASAKTAKTAKTETTGASGGAAKEAGPAKDGAPAKQGAAPAAAAGKDNKTDKGDGAPKSLEADKTASASKETPAQPRRTKSKRKSSDEEPELPPGQGPPPPSPLTVNDLRQEANRDRSPGGEFNAPPRVKLEQLLSDVGKARQSLHDDTLKLEALAGNEPSREGESTAGGAPPPPAPGAPGQPPQKNPLDVLAKALRGIKPEQAGPIVARLDKGLAATVLLRMPPVDAGKIMGVLKPEVAAELATQIAMRAPLAQSGGKR